MDLEQNEITEEVSAETATPQPKSDIKVLVVDDREDNLFSIETILEKDGYDIVKATSGRNALKILLKEHDFSLILMDVQMPEMNGFETATLIYEREKLKDIPIIFITAHNHGEELLFKGYKMGGVDYIYKPINPDLLRFKVSVFVELYRKTRQLIQQEKKLKAANQSLEKEVEERKLSESKVKLLNEQLLENYQSLKATNEELDRFAYVASHDLQEPLRKIQLFSDKIIRQGNGSLDGFVSDNLQKITKASERMQLLINDLLKFSRHTQAKEDFVQLDLNKILQDVLSDLEIQLEKRNGKVEVGQLPVLWGIPSQIQQLFQNLISNSLKFCKPGCEPLIQIFSERWVNKESADGLVRVMHRIYIKDNGIGFDSKYADEIFIVFKRLHSYHEFEGSGIGLSICKKIVDKHNGTIEATGMVNEGATFIITLPENQLHLT
jgi:signal transduction histidine kinase